jgi:hypothetical protein
VIIKEKGNGLKNICISKTTTTTTTTIKITTTTKP